MAHSARTARLTLLTSAISHPVASIFYYRAFFLVLIAGFVLYVFQGGIKKWSKASKEPFAIACFVLFLYPTITSLWSINAPETLFRSTIVLLHIIIFILTLTVVQSDPRKYPYWGVAVYAFSFIVVSATLFLIFGSLRADSAAMKSVTGAFSNWAASVALCTMPFLLHNKAGIKRKLRDYALVLMSVGVIAVSQSRSALGLFAIALVLSFLVIPGGKLNRMTQGISFALLIILVAFFSGDIIGSTPVISETVSRFRDSQLFAGGDGLFDAVINPDQSGGDYGRVLMYHHGMELIKSDWLTGSGYGTLKTYMEANIGRGSISHNWLVTTLGEMGLFGLLNFIFVAMYALWKTLAASRNKAYSIGMRIFSAQIFLSLLLLYMHGLTRPLYVNPFFSVVLGLAFWVILVGKNRKRNS